MKTIYLLQVMDDEYTFPVKCFESWDDIIDYRDYLKREQVLISQLDDREENLLMAYEDGHIPKEKWLTFRDTVDKMYKMIIGSQFSSDFYDIKAIELVEEK